MPADTVTYYFLQTGLGWAMLGAALAFSLGGVGSALGIRIAASQAAGVMSEKPELFGKLLVLMALPGTQGFYGFIFMIIIALRTNLVGDINKALAISPALGVAIAFIGGGVGLVQWWSARYQGETSAAAINLVAKRPEESGRSIILPALVETYAVVALLAGILMVLWLTAGVQAAAPAAQ
jgi:V/A-type H+-transporting ATPase subunit K